jgi:hypothetical protein
LLAEEQSWSGFHFQSPGSVADIGALGAKTITRIMGCKFSLDSRNENLPKRITLQKYADLVLHGSTLPASIGLVGLQSARRVSKQS